MIETWYNQDLSTPVKVQYLSGNVFSGDNDGNLVGVNVFKNGSPATLAGTVSAEVIRTDGGTVAVSGSRSGNQCSVILPQACYSVPGVISIVIKLKNGDEITTLCAVVANVYMSSTDTVVDPGTIIPDIAALIESIEEAVDSIPLDYSALSNGFRDSMEAMYGTSDPGTFEDKTIRRSDGIGVASTVYKITDFIPVIGSVAIYTTSPAVNATVLSERATIAFYSTNTASGYISSEGFTSGTPASILWQSTKVPSGAKYMRICIEGTLTAQFKCIQVPNIPDTISDMVAPLGKTTDISATFSSLETRIDTDAVLFSGVQYAVTLSSADTEEKTVNVYVSGDYENYITLSNGQTKYFIPTITSTVRLFNRASDGYIGTVEINIVPSTISNAVKSAVTMVSSATILSNITGGTKSMDDFPLNTIQLIGARNIGLLDKPPECEEVGIVETYTYSVAGNGVGIGQRYTDVYGKTATRIRYNNTTGWTPWAVADDVSFVPVDFTGGTAGVTTSFSLIAGRTYYFRTNVPSDVNNMKMFNVFVEGHSDSFVRCFDCWAKWTAPYTGNLRVANWNSYDGVMTLEIRPYTEQNRAVYNTPMEYHVDVNGGYSDVTSLTDMILSFVKGYNPDYENDSTALYQDESPKVIYVHSGEYDIFAEYLSEISATNPRLHAMSDIPDDISAQMWFGKYNAILPPNTKLIGLGRVVLKFTPSTSQINIGASKTWSPLNIKAGCWIENINIVCANGRYGIHDDPGTGKYGNTEHVYKNVSVAYTEDDANYGRLNTIGFGFAQNSRYLFENCELVYNGSNSHGVFYGHDSGVGNASIIVNNCIFRSNVPDETKAVRLQTIQSTPTNPGYNKIIISGTYIQSGVNYNLYNDTAQQAFDVVLLDSGEPTFTTSKPAGNTTENPYTPRIYFNTY